MQIGPYRLKEELGSGGMGAVYRAEGPDGAAVAVKVIHPHLVAKEGFLARFEREVAVGQRIRHENVVRTLDAGEAEADGKPTLFLVMELVEGQTLRALLEELGRVPEDLCLHVGREIARALAAVHGSGILHRDVKPDNVLITPDFRVKLMDLGVALIADESLRLSRSGVFVGSVLYAAPERLAERPADGRADLYALGLLLYELATGQHPFQGDDMATVIQRQLAATPRPAAEINPQLSPFFEEVVANLVHKDPDERIASAADLRTVLEEKEASAWWRDRARQLRRAAAGPLRRIRIPRETTLLGRDVELAELERLYAGVCAGAGHVVLVQGEAGIGKTRLLDEFTERLARNGAPFHVLFGSYPPGGAATAAGALSTAYREFFGSEGLEDRLAACLGETPGLVPAFAALLRGEPPPTGVAPLRREALLHAFTLATRSLAAERPTVVVVEDLHFAPELGRAIFASLAASLAHDRVLLVGTARPGLPEDWVLELERLPQASRLALRRLTPKELAALLGELFRSERLADELGWAIATKSDGNPFFVFELVRALREDGRIQRRVDGTWVRTQRITELQVPSSVFDLVEARIRDLDETSKDLLDVASCCGFEFDPILVAAALGLEQIPAMKSLAHLEKKHRLVRAVGRRYVFDHHQVQEALYRGMPVLLREPYHAALGTALEARLGAGEREPGALDGASAVALCEHFLRGAQGPKALRYLPGAVEHLAGGYLHDEAIALLDRALAVPDLVTGPLRIDLLLRRAEAQETRGHQAEGRATLEEARVLADTAGDAALGSRVRALLGRLCVWASQYDEARAWFEESLRLAREAGDPAREGAAIGNLGILAYRSRDFDEAQGHFERCLAILRERGDRRGMAVATLNLGNVLSVRGRFAEAREHYDRSRALAREIAYRDGESLAAGNLGMVLRAQGDLAEALAHTEEAIALAGQVGDRHKTAVFAESLGNIHVQLGRPARARREFERALAIAREAGMRREEATALSGLGHVAEEEGDLPGALRLMEEALELHAKAGEPVGEAHAQFSVAQLLRETGGRKGGRGDRGDGACAEADALLQRALDRARELDDPGLEMLCRASLLAGDPGPLERRRAAVADRIPLPQRMHLAWLLFEATGDRAHLREAASLLAHLERHAPADARSSLREGNRLHRKILAAAGDA